MPSTNPTAAPSPVPVIAGVLPDDALVRIAAPTCRHACPPGLDAWGCARAWEEVVPCNCLECHQPIGEVTARGVLALIGLPTAPGERWMQVPTARGVLMVPAATVAAIEARR